MKLHSLKSVITSGIGLGVICFGLGFAAHWIMSGSEIQNDSAETGKATPERKPLYWSCSMHPEVQMPGPGTCPKCPMALMPVYDSGGTSISLRQISLSPEAVALMNIQTSPAERQFVTAEVRMNGKVEFDETRLKYLTARMAGRLDRLFVDSTGIPVKKNDHLAQLYSEELYTAQDVLIKAYAERGKTKSRNPLLPGSIDIVESTREKLRLWGMTPEQIREIENLKKPADHITIYSPIEGIVTQKYLREGDRVKTGDRIYAIADLSHVWITLDAYESDLTWLRFGQQVTFTTDAYPGETFEGRISLIPDFLNPKTRTVKIRVSVKNTQGKLKPEMFVRAQVRAELASEGRVMDAGLAGKWVSPMHPEVIRDKPGKCPICGMPLVTAEELGYVSAKLGNAIKPLVIPASAALVTGTRAIVYVEIPGTKQPTFEGREIVLGARAGDFYLVKSGLEEKELVVTNGNFKIDSALQIRTKPSMMTPQGGGGGGHAHHHGASPTPKSAEKALEMKLPLAFQSYLTQVEMAFRNVMQAHHGGNKQQLQLALKNLKSGLQNDKEATRFLSGHAKLMWKELSMLLENDIVETRDAKTIQELQQFSTKLMATIKRTRMQFGLSEETSAHPFYDTPTEFQQQLSCFWNGYLDLQKQLAGDDLKASQQAVELLLRTIVRINMHLLEPQAHTVWIREAEKLMSSLKKMKESSDLKTLRIHFEPLSHAMLNVVHSFNVGPGNRVYRIHCPMAFKNKGAFWLQKDNKVQNPYYGAKMLTCADTLTLISDGKNRQSSDDHAQHDHAPKKEEHQHE